VDYTLIIFLIILLISYLSVTNHKNYFVGHKFDRLLSLAYFSSFL